MVWAGLHCRPRLARPTLWSRRCSHGCSASWAQFPWLGLGGRVSQTSKRRPPNRVIGSRRWHSQVGIGKNSARVPHPNTQAGTSCPLPSSSSHPDDEWLSQSLEDIHLHLDHKNPGVGHSKVTSPTYWRVSSYGGISIQTMDKETGQDWWVWRFGWWSYTAFRPDHFPSRGAWLKSRMLLQAPLLPCPWIPYSHLALRTPSAIPPTWEALIWRSMSNTLLIYLNPSHGSKGCWTQWTILANRSSQRWIE